MPVATAITQQETSGNQPTDDQHLTQVVSRLLSLCILVKPGHFQGLIDERDRQIAMLQAELAALATQHVNAYIN